MTFQMHISDIDRQFVVDFLPFICVGVSQSLGSWQLVV